MRRLRPSPCLSPQRRSPAERPTGSDRWPCRSRCPQIKTGSPLTCRSASPHGRKVIVAPAAPTIERGPTTDLLAEPGGIAADSQIADTSPGVAGIRGMDLGEMREYHQYGGQPDRRRPFHSVPPYPCRSAAPSIHGSPSHQPHLNRRLRQFFADAHRIQGKLTICDALRQARPSVFVTNPASARLP